MKNPLRNQLSKRYGPGVWEDAAGGIHFSITELLELFELEDTPQNRAQAEVSIRKVLMEKCPSARIVYRETPKD